MNEEDRQRAIRLKLAGWKRRGPAPASTGFAALDRALGAGGLPRGAHRRDLRPRRLRQDHARPADRGARASAAAHAAWIDADRTFDPAYAARLGVAIERLPGAARLRRRRPSRSPHAWPPPARVDLLVVDSAAALVPQTRAGGRHRRARPGPAQPRAGFGTAAPGLALRARGTGWSSSTRRAPGGRPAASARPAPAVPPLKLHAAVRIALRSRRAGARALPRS